MDDRVIYIRWSDDGRFIRKWDTKPFDGAEPMYSRSWLLSEEAILRTSVAICEERTWAGAWSSANEVEHAAWYRDARAALTAAIGEDG